MVTGLRVLRYTGGTTTVTIVRLLTIAVEWTPVMADNRLCRVHSIYAKIIPSIIILNVGT